MTIDLNIYRVACAIIDTHGKDASICASKRADEFLEKGDMEKGAFWKRILEIVDDLLAMEKTGGI